MVLSFQFELTRRIGSIDSTGYHRVRISGNKPHLPCNNKYSTNYYYLYIQMNQLGTFLDPFCLQIDWVNFMQILWIFEISNSNLNETAFRYLKNL